ncbi:plasmid segregation protein ParM domain-containing protein [Edwardsiella tarda]
MKIFCDDGSTNVKLAWHEGTEVKTLVSTNSFRSGWQVEGLGNRAFNYELDGKKYTYDPVSTAAIATTHIEYQYSDVNVLAVHHALLSSGLEPQAVSLIVTLPISEFYQPDCQKNERNIQRKIDNLLRAVSINKGTAFKIESVEVMPESLPAVFTRLVQDNVGSFEKSLVIDLGGTTLDAGVITGQFDGITAIHGNPNIGVSSVTKATQFALKMADSETSPLVTDELIKRRNQNDFVSQVVNDSSKIQSVMETMNMEIEELGSRVVDELASFRHVNRVYIVGGGASLISDAVKEAWNHLGDKVVTLENPQTALVRAIAEFKGV